MQPMRFYDVASLGRSFTTAKMTAQRRRSPSSSLYNYAEPFSSPRVTRSAGPSRIFGCRCR
jgi:hypothetical protein